MVKIGTWLKTAAATLSSAGIPSSRLDSLILTEFSLGIDRAKLLSEPAQEISSEDEAKLNNLLNRRAAHEPIAYIRGYTEFYGRNFVITPAVLEPRPETETMIELLLKLVGSDDSGLQRDKDLLILDVGTGSGALGITAQLELPEAQVDLIEIDEQAIQVAKTNVDKFTSGINIVKSDLLEGCPSDYVILLCNLPYVPDDYQINHAAGHEPRLAIFGGPDGLDLYRKLFRQIASRTNQPLYILTESLPTQHEALTSIATEYGYKLQETDSFVQVFKLSAKSKLNSD